MYIVVRNNKVLDYCESGYSYVGSVVVCEDKGCKFDGATIINIGSTNLPSDIDCCEYYYIHGEFVLSRIVESPIIHVVLYATQWSGQQYTIPHASIREQSIIDLIPDKSITLEQLQALQQASIVEGSQSVGTLVLKALDKVPTIDIPINLILRGDM